MHLIGFMQGRLCAPVDGKIQAFPWDDWESEFPAAAAVGLHAMEWTLDQDRLYGNPLMTSAGRERIRTLSRDHQIDVPSLTGDCFMQAPFWKEDGEARDGLIADFLAICSACSAVGMKLLVVPLVDNGRLDNARQEAALVEFLLAHENFLADEGLQVAFESDFVPAQLRRFIDQLPHDRFGVNYDIGNSAALGYDPAEEFAAYGSRVLNVHVKDRVRGGTTVPLTTGAARFEVVFAQLAAMNYQGNLILQTARAADGNHAGVLRDYYEMTVNWMRRSGLRVA